MIGPLNGGVPWPKEFDSARRAEREWLSYVRDAYRLIPGYRSTRRHANAIICASRATLEQMPSWCSHKCHYIPENGVDPARFDKRVADWSSKPLRVAFVGRFVPYKCPDLLVEAAAPLVRAGVVTLDLIGDGPLMPKLKSMVAELGIGDGVRLDGWVPHQHVQDRLVQSQVFGFPSIREFGGGVVLEAMALGLVPIVVDYAGPGELVDESVGFKVPICDRPEMVQRFRHRLELLAASPSELQVLSERAWNLVRSRYTWSAKAEQVCEVYNGVLSDSPRRRLPR